jgi:hypothetical protein
MSKFTFGLRHLIRGLDAVADAFAGTVYSDVVNIANYDAAEFIVHKGVGTTGTSKLTVEACSNAAGDDAEAVEFSYQRHTGATDVPAAVVNAAATGFDTTAGSSELYSVQVDSQKLPEGKSWVRLKAVEQVNDPVLGGILIVLHGPRYAAQAPATAIA